MLSFRRDGGHSGSLLQTDQRFDAIGTCELCFPLVLFTFLYYNLTSNSWLSNQSAWLSKTGRVNVLSLPLSTPLNLTLRSKGGCLSGALKLHGKHLYPTYLYILQAKPSSTSGGDTKKNCLWYIWTTHGIFSWKLSVPVNYWAPQ